MMKQFVVGVLALAACNNAPSDHRPPPQPPPPEAPKTPPAPKPPAWTPPTNGVLCSSHRAFTWSLDGGVVSAPLPRNLPDDSAKLAALDLGAGNKALAVATIKQPSGERTIALARTGSANIALFDVSASPPKKLFSMGEVTDGSRGTIAMSPSNELVAFYAGGPIELGAVWIWRPTAGAAPKRISTAATGLALVDQYDRLWLERQGAIIVRTNSGKEQLYSKASLIDFGWKPLRCTELGTGFPTLPAPPDQKKGTLTIAVQGAKAANAAFVTCALTATNPPCRDELDVVRGSLDANGTWTGQVPVGNYTVALNVDGQWYGTEWFKPGAKNVCLVKEGISCDLHYEMK